MQSMQNTVGNGFLSSEDIAKELIVGYDRRMLRSSQQRNQVFMPSKIFFDKLIADWVYENRSDSRTLYLSHKVAGLMNCNDLADEWWRCFLRNPFDSSPLYAPNQLGFTSPFLFERDEGIAEVAKVYMIGLAGFKNPDVRRIVITERVPILIPIYNISVAAEEHLWDADRGVISEKHGEISKALTTIIIDDLCGLYDIVAEFDKMPISGLTVLRNIPYQVNNIPPNNVRGVPSERLGQNKVMNVCHGGFYIMLNPNSEALNKGEHLLYFRALSVNYEIEAKVHIGVLAS
jgi:hypothetical protein